MRIVLINQFYIPDTAATGQLLADVAEDLAAEGHEVHVICSRRTYDGGGNVFVRNEVIEGVNVYRVGATGFGRGKALGRLLDWLSFYLFALWRAFCLPKMDVCVALTTPPFIALIGVLLHHLRHTQLVIWSMDVYPEIAVVFDTLTDKGLPHKLFMRLSRRIYKAASAIISLGDVMAERLAEAGAPRDRITVVHNWVPRETVGS